MAREKGMAGELDWKALLSEEEGFLRTLVQATVQQVLEAEMEEALQASESERTQGRLGYPPGLYPDAPARGRNAFAELDRHNYEKPAVELRERGLCGEAAGPSREQRLWQDRDRPPRAVNPAAARRVGGFLEEIGCFAAASGRFLGEIGCSPYEAGCCI